MKNQLEYSSQPAFNPSACPNAPPPYSDLNQQMHQPIQQMPQPVQQMPQIVQQMTQPVQQMPQLVQQMPQPCVNITMNNQSQRPQYAIAPSYLGQSSVRMVCPNCRAEMMTSVSTDCSTKQHIIALLLFLSGIFTCCSCLPYCCNDCGVFRHSCPRCRMHIGSYSP